MSRLNLKRAALTALTILLGDGDGRVTVPTVRGPARGLRFRLDLQRNFETAYLLGSYELPVVRRVAQICRTGWTVWDCGSYLGFYTALFARLVGSEGCVVAFEPDPANMSRTKENVALNGFRNVRYVQAAIGGVVGEVDFVHSDNTNSHIPGTWVGDTRTEYAGVERIDTVGRVRCLSLDEVYLSGEMPAPQLIKLDIEGAEVEALRHAHRLVREVEPAIVLELHNSECFAAAWEFAKTAGYTLRSPADGRFVHRWQDVWGALLCLPAG